MTEKLIAKLEKPPISRRSCCAYPSRDRSSSSRRRSSSRLGIALRVLLGGHVRGGYASVDGEGRAVDVGRVVRGQEQRGLRDLPGLRQSSRRDVHHAARPAGRIGEELLQKRRIDRPGTEGVRPDAL